MNEKAPRYGQPDSALAAGDEVLVTPAHAVELANRAHRAGHLDEAERIYRMVLEAKPDDADAMNFLGILEYHSNREEAGFARVQRSVELCPDHADFLNNLGNLHKECGELAEAESAYRRVLDLRADDADAWSNLGVVLAAQERFDAAREVYDRALELAPEHADAWHNLGGTLRRMGELDAAAKAYDRAIDLRPFSARSHLKLGALYYLNGEFDAALKVYRRWQEQDPENPVPEHMIAGLGGGEAPARASDAFVTETFDGFASSFDHVLHRLEYRAPQLVADALRAALGEPSARLDVLDAGCGTGLSGVALAPFAARLDGVDLSPRMVAKARLRGLYAALDVAELTAYLSAAERQYDVVASADTLCYFGALRDVLAGAFASLRPGGSIVFTVEQMSAGAGEGFRLNPHGRYSHAREYVERVLGEVGFDLVCIAEAVLRKENQADVAGLVVSAVRPQHPDV